MSHKSSTAAICSAVAFAGVVPMAAQAQANETWKWEAALYGYLPSISGKTAFPTSSGSTINIDADSVIDALNFTFMGQIEARRGKWGLWTDLVYADVGSSKQGTRDFTVNRQTVGVDGNLSLDVKALVWSLAGIYNLTATPESTTDLLFGARLIDMKQEMNWSVSSDVPALPGRSGASSVEVGNWDAIIGVKGRHHFSADRRWFVPYYLDIGTGESSFTWQINAGVGYRFDWGAMFATWRYLDYDFKSGKPAESLNMSGPVFGVGFQW